MWWTGVERCLEETTTRRKRHSNRSKGPFFSSSKHYWDQWEFCGTHRKIDCNDIGTQIVQKQPAPSSPQNEGTSGSLTVDCNNDVDVVGDTHQIPHIQKQQPPSPRGTCLAVDCNEIITAQGYLCKFHRVAKVVVLKNDESKQELRWCHYCKKVQRLDEFSEASKTLCHAKYVLRCERSKKKREKLRIRR